MQYDKILLVANKGGIQMKTKILMFLMIAIAIISIGTINVEGNNHASVSNAEELANVLEATYNGNVVTLQKDVDLFGGQYGEPMMLHIMASEEIILDLNGFSIEGVEIRLFSNLHVKNGTINRASISYWDTLTIENAIVIRIKWTSRIFYKC